MKKIRISGRGDNPFWNKSFKLLKLSFLFLFIGLVQVSAGSYSRSTKLTLEMRSAKVADVLDAIESKSEFRFAYSPGFIDLNRVVSVDIHEKSIEESLKVIFAGTEVDFAVHDRHIILYPEAMDSGNKNANVVRAQQRTITGTVTDTRRQPLPGVTVVVKGTTNGTITNTDGKFSLPLPANAEVLQFSFVGMKPQEVVIGNQTTLNIQLEEETIGIEEVVAIGYGTRAKRDLTGAVAQVTTENLEKESPGSVQDLLRANIPGLNVGISTNAKGGGTMRIRGDKSLKASNDPLLVVDGVIFFGELSEINPNDIEAIDVLKDASSAAVYGAKAAAGVVIITTKKGKEGKPMIRFDASVGAATMGANMKVYDAEGYLGWRQKVQESINANAKPGEYAKPTPDNLARYGITLDQWLAYRTSTGEAEKDWLQRLGLYENEVNNYFNGRTYDWYDASFQDGLRQDYNASISGRSREGVSYYWSIGYNNNEGIVKGDEYNSYRSNLKLNTEITSWLSVGANVNFQQRSENGETVDWGAQIINNSPYSLPYDMDGNMIKYPMGNSSGGSTNSLFDISYRDRRNGWYTLNSIFNAKIKLPLNITYEVNYSPRLVWHYWQMHESSAHPEWKVSHNGLAERQSRTNFDWQVDNIVRWNQTFGGKHAFEVTLLQNAEEKRQWEETMTARDFSPTDALGYHYMRGANMQRSTISSNDYHATADALMGRMFYSFNKKYMLTGTVRRDGYSAFGQRNPRATFPSFALGWVFTEESFINIPAMNFGKIRYSWGQNGNRAIGMYDALSNMTTGSGKYTYIMPDGTVRETSQLYVDRMSNKDLKWESTTSNNLGLDMEFFDSRISTNIDAYLMSTTDLLVDRRLPDILGFNSVASNLGEIENRGLEVTLNTRNVEKPNFSWSTSVNFSMNRNKIKHLYFDYEDVKDADGNVIGTKEKDDKSNGWFIGQDISTIWNYKVVGVWQLEEQEQAAKYGQKPGDVKILDVNEDFKYNDDDKMFLGTTTPKFRWSMRNSFTFFKNFDLSFMMYSYWGQKSTYDRPLHKNGFLDRTSSYVIPFWTPDNPINDYTRLYSDDKNLGARFIREKSFIRLDNVSLSYNLPKKLINRLDLQDMRLYGSVRNVGVWAPDWDFWDPENSGPTPRTFTVGVNFTL